MAKLFAIRTPKPAAPPRRAITPAPLPANNPTLPPPDAEGAAADEAAALAVQDRRGRSRIGTVATSWRGVLDPGALVPVRKSLLGE